VSTRDHRNGACKYRGVALEDVAALAVHLMTSTAITGATIDIAGGQQLIGF